MFFYNKSDVVEFQIMPKLVKAEIKVNFRFEIPLKVASNVEYLRFFIKPDTECFPVFHNLIHLEVSFWFVVRWNLVFEMIKHCPKLQTFVLFLPLESFPPMVWTFPQIVPECISSKLRRCTIMNYKAIATSLLSKRWKPLWHSVPAFDLDDEPFLQNDKPYSSFLTFAYVAILSRNPSHSITHFHLNSSVCRNQNDLLHFNIWLNAIVVQLDVKHLQIEAPRNHSLALLQILSSIFNYKTLVVLKLCRLFVDSNSVESVHLPELKTPPLDDARMLETRYLPHCRGFAKRLRF
ncbi:F-box/FBD/LRR-repeat protein [Glycine max]|nr:F-box/FBD/LRR-repeat protein [Glycine max]